MFSFLHQRNKYTTIDFVPGLGVVLLILIHDRYFICRRGIWYESIPTAFPEQFTNQTYEPPRRHQVPCIMSKAETEKQRIREKLERSVKAVEQACRETQLLDEMDWDTDSVEEYTSEEEEEEPIYWEFVKHLVEETDDRIIQDLEQEENYMIARFDIH